MWTVTDAGTLVSRPVRVIQEIQDTVFVRVDMAAAPRIVISDLPVMTEGMEVRIEGLDDPSTRTAHTDSAEERDEHMAGGGGGQ